ncbi:Kae1-like domain-containing protein [Clostridium felsineum]|uniref:Carbamoyltransferase HypF n=1 Tax=Clostridium felsineum TaxID=36839 RepID=A0A1S8LUD4_9CLOT|nr:hypothetical protein [Clostridium felsineum]MCR3760034.1 hypothetical protein [Clostridium felsineum]URZ04526.1 Carbamoyltransferase HypF [Clostridium felsineum]URZ09320.1 Carbamoyltransferase HypF [Clostridium felsineum]URZ14006.1 Carbamoyltransferase HypF [Clostridium felsineum]URZ18753.1 Carbamoyltransferase HypF [Clostridium felsineum DSM 794]
MATSHNSKLSINHYPSKSIIIVYDDMTLGSDKNLWGGEFFIGTKNDFKRAAHFQYVTLQGYDKAIKEPFRCAISYLNFFKCNPDKFIDNMGVVKAGLNKNLNCYKSSSLEGLFNCVSALLKLVYNQGREGKASELLENIAAKNVQNYYKYKIKNENNMFIIELKSIINGVLRDINSNIEKSIISAKFHNTISHITLTMSLILSKINNVNNVILSGHIFENQHLLKSIYEGLKNSNFEVCFDSSFYIKSKNEFIRKSLNS